MLGIKLNLTKFKISNTLLWKRLAIFLAFEFVFSALTMPLLIFYGPFENVKRTMVGTSWATLRHQYIAKTFLSDQAIERFLGDGGYYAQEEAMPDTKLKLPVFKVVHTDKIEVMNVEGGDFTGKLMVIYDPTRLAIGYSSQMPKSGETTSSIAKRNGAVAAINAGGFIDSGWTGTGGMPDGFIIHNGKVVSNSLEDEDTPVDTVAFTDKGVLIVGKQSITDLKKYKVKEAVSFGPPLVVNGKPTLGAGNDGGWGIAPRTAIAQREDGAVLMLVIDGRSIKSLGAYLRDVQDIFLHYGAVNAVNLDGGSSTTMFYNGKVINRPSDALGERTVPSAFMVLPMNEGAK